MTKESIKDDQGREITDGMKVSWKDPSGTRNGLVVADDAYEDGLRIRGRSLRAIWNDSDNMLIAD